MIALKVMMMKSLKAINKVLLSLPVALLLLTVFSGITAGKSSMTDIAINGYDTVAYFSAGKAIKGSESFTFRWHEMTWYFISEENRDLFSSGPGKYAPRYDGYCAWAMTESRKARADPEVWKIVNGKLYLNCSKSAFKKWSRDIPGNIKKADRNWTKISEN